MSYAEHSFIQKILMLFDFDPDGTEWVSLGDVLNAVVYRPEFRFNYSLMVLWLREYCQEKGLRREDRILEPSHVDTVEGYFGIIRKG